MKKDVNSNVTYHYCSVEAFFNIIQNKTLWLSDAEYMNDKQEIIWIDKVVNHILDELYDDTRFITYRDTIDTFKNTYNEISHKKHYFISFSKEKDLLSQWRGYADDSFGVSIVFDISWMVQPRSSYVSECLQGNIEVGTFKLGYEDIIYNTDFFKEQIIKIIEQSATKSSIVLLKELATSLKNPCFKEENETRIIYTPSNSFQEEQNSFIDDAVKKMSDLKYRIKDRQIIPYYEFDFNTKNNSLVVPEVIFGSKCCLNEQDIRIFLDTNGFQDTKIIKSNSTYQ